MNDIPSDLRELLDERYNLKSALTANAKTQKILEARHTIVNNEINNIRNNCPHDTVEELGKTPIFGKLYTMCTNCMQQFRDGVKVY